MTAPNLFDNIFKMFECFDPHDSNEYMRIRRPFERMVQNFPIVDTLVMMWYERNRDEETTQTTKTQAGAM